MTPPHPCPGACRGRAPRGVRLHALTALCGAVSGLFGPLQGGEALAQWAEVPGIHERFDPQPTSASEYSPLEPFTPDELNPGLWREGGNPAGLADAGLPEHGWFRARALRRTGSLRSVQDPEESTALRMEMSGDRRVGSWHAFGRFDYTRTFDGGVRWSAVDRPRGGSPYVWTDSTGGDWERDDVVLRGAIGSESELGIGVALEARYGQGARRNDPRPLLRIRDLKLVPGLTTERGPWTLGTSLHLESVQEEGEIGYFAGDNPFVYRLRGYGTFDRTQLVRAVRTREGRRLGVGIQAHRGGERWTVSGAAQLLHHTDSIRQGIAAPEFGGSYARTEGRIATTFRRSSGSGGRDFDGPPTAADPLGRTLEIRLQGSTSVGEGIDPVFRAVNTEDRRHATSAAIQIWPGDAERSMAPWSAGLLLKAARTRREDVAAATHSEVTRGTAELDGSRLLGRVGSSVPPLRMRGSAGLSLGLAEDWAAESPTRITDVLVRPDHLMDHTDRWRASLGVVWFRSVAPEVSLMLEADVEALGLIQKAPEELGVSGRLHRAELRIGLSLLH